MPADDTGTATAMADGSLSVREPPRVLIPVEVLEGQTVPQSLVDFLAPAEVVVLGYHVLPEQTPTEQASMQFEERARAAVDDIAQTFAAAGREVEQRVAFTHDRDKTLDRVAAEVDATAVLLSNPTGEISEVLVPIRGAVDVDRLADLVATLMDESDGQVTLWALLGGADTIEAEQVLDDATATLRERGLSDEQIRTESSDVEAPTHAVVDRSGEFDVIVMGEGERSLLTTVIGETTERIAEGAVAPVLVVRRRTDD
jgi:nucleotide-binding universal stress UspA family protein